MEKALRGGEGDNSTEAWRQGIRMNMLVNRKLNKIIMTIMEDATYDVEGAIGEKGLLEETKGRCQCGFCFWEQEGEEEGRATT